ncbi:MAG: AbrB/MazE/SpoVT family DNA-binding domain-containing protein [Aeromicrobium sp.]|uniref:AbrB/MazE/SpoVT family DNA-binding domain-containing protein n=1 Tax=Aeromicrobium sp. TaxID=1871063 RepID=UPI0039E31FB5
MSIATVTSKGQVTIPKDVRDELGLEPGAHLSFTPTENGAFIVRRASRSVRRLRGAIAYDGPPVTVEQMNDSIAEAAAESQR